jgi:hypothetical protein
VKFINPLTKAMMKSNKQLREFQTSDKATTSDKYDYEKNLNALLAQQNFASEFCKKLYTEINEFDSDLDAEDEVVARLVNFGEIIQFGIESIGFSDPSLIIFIGHTSDGSHVQLVQHVSQISILLLSAKRPDPEKPKFPIGFRQVT